MSIVDLTALRRLLETGDHQQALQHLRHRHGTAPTSFAALPLASARTMSWHHITRLPSRSPDALAQLDAVVASVWASGHQVALLISAVEEEAPSLAIGIHNGGLTSTWMTSLLGPGTQLHPYKGTPPALDLIDNTSLQHQHLLTVRSEPQTSTTKKADNEQDGIPVAFLDRLLAMPTESFAVLVTCIPLPTAQIERAHGDSEAALDIARRKTSHTEQMSEGISVTTDDPVLTRIAEHLSLFHSQLSEARSSGGWFTEIRVVVPCTTAQSAVIGAVATALSAQPLGDAKRVTDVTNIDPTAAPGEFSFLSTPELARLLTSPATSIATLEVLEAPPSASWVVPTERALDLGLTVGTQRRFAVDVEDLEGHVFLSGTTGSGKSTTLWRILSQLWNRWQIPFLIIDPVKSEHKGLASLLNNGMACIDARDLRLSVLEPYPGFSRETHLGLVSSAFRGSFSLPHPVPYVLRLLFDRLTWATGSPITLHDLYGELGPLTDQLGYQGDIDSNIRAALGTRLALLTEPHRAERLCAFDQHQLHELLSRPTLILLKDVGDDDERAFLMAVLTIYVAEAARMRGDHAGLGHITVLEEAHRVLPQPQPLHTDSTGDGGDAASTTARQLTQLLAEIRSFGESVIVIDQSPAAVAREVIRNTGLKIIHRSIDPSDREVSGGAVGLSPERTGPLGHLAPGEAVVAGRRIRSPQTVKITQTIAGNTPTQATPSRSSAWPCCSGGYLHHLSEMDGEEAELAVSLSIASVVLGINPERDAFPALITTHQQHQPACLAYIGLRRYLRTLISLSQLPSGRFAEILEKGLAGYVANGTFNQAAAMLGATLLERKPPWSGCRDCRSRCVMRAISVGAVRTQRTRLSSQLTRAASGQEIAYIEPWMRQIQTQFTPQLGVASADLALCIVIKTLSALGLGDHAGPFLGERPEDA